jgi:hypothetical protein
VDWENVTLATVGFGLYCLALILKSTSLRHLRFARIVDLAQIHRVPRRYRVWMQHGSLALSMLLMGAALWQTINTDRSSFQLLANLAAMLVGVRLLGFFFTRVSLIVLEIETDPASKLSLTHLRRSPFILGGFALLIVGAGVPPALDSFLQARFDSYRQEEWQALVAKAKREGFEQNYIPRSLKMKGRAQNENEFFSRVLLRGHRVVIQGRAGVGKSWFLMQLRFWFHARNPGTTVIFLNAQDLQPGEDLVGHVSHTVFGGLAWGARPVARRILAQALILIDGLDEVHSLNRDDVIGAITQLAQDKTLAHNMLIVTTRPTNLQQLLQAGFVVAELPTLTASESLRVLASPDRNAKLARKLRELAGRDLRVDERALRLFYSGPLPDWAHINAEQTARLHRAFLDSFGFSVRTPGASGETVRMPFLSTYRDLDIVEELFLNTLSAKPVLPARTHSQMRTGLIEQFVRRRIELNYHAAPDDRTFPQRVIDALTLECAEYLRETPHATTFRFDRRRFERVFNGTTLDKVVLESELLTEAPESERLVFDNPVLDEYFFARARRLGHDPLPGGL